MSQTDNIIVPRFFVHSMPDNNATKKNGRPCFKDMECVELRFPGNRQTISVFPAHEISHWKEDMDGTREPITYAMRFTEQYKRFKDGAAQAMSGTPLEELPFLTQAKRLELKALNIYTAEQLASVDGHPLKQLGMQGRELKNQAQAYLDNAAGSADVTRLASDNVLLKEQISALEKQVQQLAVKTFPQEASPFSEMDVEALKLWIADATGSRPKGNPSHETLIRMADEINRELKAKKEAA